MELSQLTRIIEPTLSRQIFMMAKQYDDVIDFTLGDPDLHTPRAISEAAYMAALRGKTRYAPNAGLQELREAIAQKVSKESGNSYTAGNVAVTMGATEALYLAFMTVLNPGDEVIILAPYWVQYKNIVSLLGARPVIVDEFGEGFEPSLEAINRSVNSRTKAIVVNSPNNPSGCVYGKGFLKKLAEIANKKGLMVFADEVYRSLVYDKDYTSISTYCRRNNLMIFNSFSKQFAMTGWRVGYVVAGEERIQNIVKFQQNIAVCVATPNQYAALEALKNAESYEAEIKSTFQARRDILLYELGKIKGLRCLAPKGTFYAFIDISSTDKDSRLFSFSLLEDQHVAVVPGVAFGANFDNYIRLAFTLSDDKIVEGLNRVNSFMQSL